VRLFADRAAAVRPDFAVDDGTVADVVRLCRALDGLPLAIELAAARLRALPPATLAARLDDRFRLLSRGDPAALPRHRTLRAVVEWSWELLDGAEQALARRFTVFAGGASPAAVEAVCGAGPDPLEALAGLVDKSLIDLDRGRYRMLETVRAFCAERLAGAGEAAGARRDHAAHFLDLARAADPMLRRAEQLEWLRRLDADRDNLTAAVRRSTEDGDLPTALRLVSALSSYWWLRGLRQESAGLARELLAAVGARPPAGFGEEYALCLLLAAWDGSREPALDRIEALLLDLPGPPRQPMVYLYWAIASGPRDPAAAPFAEPTGNDWNAALVRLGHGLTQLFGGAAGAAERELSAAHAGFRSVGDRWGMTTALAELATLADWRGDRATADALLDEAFGHAAALESAEDLAELLSQRGHARVAAGDLDGAAGDYRRAAGVARRAGVPANLAEARLGLAQVARLRGDLPTARELVTTALAGCPRGSFRADLVRVHGYAAHGRLAEAAGDADAARGWYRRALAEMPAAGRVEAARVAEGLAGVALLDGDAGRAALLLGAGTALRGAAVAGDPDVARVAAAARDRLGAAAFGAARDTGAALAPADALALLSADCA
jgi:tetratricopeptide (TPR) repeat protein